MKKFLFVLTFISSSVLYASSYSGYTFTADNSYLASDGNCVQSVILVTHVGKNLFLTSTSSGTEIISLKTDQLKAFAKLANRNRGETIIVIVKNGGDILTFKGESCGSFQCDSLTIHHENGSYEVLEQPIHGLAQINCNLNRF